MPYASFDKINAEREAAGETLFANPRNAKRVMTCKFALAKSEIAAAPDSPAAKRAAAKE